ncbi:P68 family surface lipoprotein [Mesomycoplasma conjunctivae]|uniref:P68 family surface lipoprotein n=1 Tax=Mesomycoplasma conjunctivae TaxID=45361 RepID=UPI003DA20CA9
MKTKFNKTKLLAISSTLGLGVTAFVSCGVSFSRYDTAKDGKIVFGHSFSSTGNEAKVIDAIVKAWNEQAKDLPGFLRMEISPFSGSYNGAASQINTYLESKDQNKLPNIITNYPSLLAIVNKYDMTLPFVSDFESQTTSSSESEVVKNAENSVRKFLKDKTAPTFLDINKEIPLLDPKGIYSIPFAKSTEILSINQMVLGYIIDQATKDTNPATIAEDSKEFFEKMTTLINSEQKKADLEEVKKIWKEYSPSEQGLSGYVFKRETFNNYTDLFDLARRIKVAFPKLAEGNDLTKAKAVFGIDTSPNAIFELVSSVNNGDKSKNISVLNRDIQQVDYTSYFNDKNSDRYKSFKLAYDLLKSGIKDKTTYYSASGEFNSSFFKNHQEVFSTGSSAGYFHNFFEKNNKKTTLTFKDKNGEEKSVNIDKPQFSVTIDKNTTFEKEEKGSRYKFKSPSSRIRFSEKTKEKVEEFIKTLKDDEKTFLFTSEELIKGIDQEVVQNLDNDTKFKPFVVKVSNFVSVVAQDANSQLNEDELLVISAPTQYANDSKYSKSVISQGPDLIGIHANAEEDEATKVFVNWFLTAEVQYPASLSKNEKKTKTMTGIDFWTQNTSYITPFKETFENTKFATDRNLGKRVSWEQFKKFFGQNESNYKLIYDAADSQSASFRSGLRSAFDSVQSRAIQGEDVDFDGFLGILKTNLGPSFS